jgi:CO dehydrogenase/acetyl-CoA synthase delta subunit
MDKHLSPLAAAAAAETITVQQQHCQQVLVHLEARVPQTLQEPVVVVGVGMMKKEPLVMVQVPAAVAEGLLAVMAVTSPNRVLSG